MKSAPVVVALPPCDSRMSNEEIDRNLGLVARAHEKHEVITSQYLREVERRRLHDRYGHKNTVEYAERRHGIQRSTAYRLMRAARACERSPQLREAFLAGRVDYSKIDVVAPMLKGTDADAEWVERVTTLSRPRLQAAVNAARGLETADIVVRIKVAPSQATIMHLAWDKCSKTAGRDLGHGEFIEYVCAEYLAQIVDESELRRAGDGTSDETSSTGGTLSLLELDRLYRLDVHDRDNWQCVSCDERCDLTVDHILCRALFPRLRWSRANGVTLCAPCHRLKTDGFIRIERQLDGALHIIRAGDARIEVR